MTDTCVLCVVSSEDAPEGLWWLAQQETGGRHGHAGTRCRVSASGPACHATRHTLPTLGMTRHWAGRCCPQPPSGCPAAERSPQHSVRQTELALGRVVSEEATCTWQFDALTTDARPCALKHHVPVSKHPPNQLGRPPPAMMINRENGFDGSRRGHPPDHRMRPHGHFCVFLRTLYDTDSSASCSLGFYHHHPVALCARRHHAPLRTAQNAVSPSGPEGRSLVQTTTRSCMHTLSSVYPDRARPNGR